MIGRDFLWAWIQRDPLRYHSLHADMISARVGMTLEQYLWRSVKLSLAVGSLFAVLGYFISTYFSLQILTGRAGIHNVFNIQFPVIFNAVYPAEYM